MKRNPGATCATCPYWADKEPDRHLSEVDIACNSPWRLCCYDIPGNQVQTLSHQFCRQHPDFELHDVSHVGGFAGRHQHRSTD